MSVKTFILDTNVLLHNADCIHSFADNTVVLPMAVIEELDKFKAQNNELARNARAVIRELDALRTRGNLKDGVKMENKGTLKILSDGDTSKQTGLTKDIADNRIIGLAYALHRKGETVVFVSKDINARVKADALGLNAVDFEKQKVNIDELYTGLFEREASREMIDTALEKGTLKDESLGRYPNEFLLLKDPADESHSALGRVSRPGVFHVLRERELAVWTIKPRNREQRMALELLVDPQVQIVTLVGQAGTGKTLLALAAALQETVRNHRYDRVLVSRPIMPMGKDLGYLPGDKEEKLANWMEPIFDNLAYLLRERGEGAKSAGASIRDRIDQMTRDNIIEMEALTYIRGRSIPGQYILIDEAQNLTPHEIKTVVSRAGEGSKMVLTGDPYQIDNPYLDSASNGLTYAAEQLKGQQVHGHVTLNKSERSALAAIAAEHL
ncbi:MAG: PhoH family protein [Kiritimatiellia bacterium]